MIEYKLGQELWIELFGYGRTAGRLLKVTKIGRKWVSLGDDRHPDQFRVEIGEVRVDGGGYGCAGRLWNTEQECDDNRTLEKGWEQLMLNLRYLGGAPKGLTLEKLLEVKKLLGFDP
jgi:hypothetical protein